MLDWFFLTATNDVRLSSTHLSLYFVLYRYWLKNDHKNPIAITRKEVMRYAKIKGLATYTKCMHELNDYGYITYLPSYNPATGSTVYLHRIHRLKRL